MCRRFLRAILYLSITATSAAALAAPERHETQKIAAGAWRGGSFAFPDGSFAHCAIGIYHGSTIFVFYLGRDYAFEIGLSDTGWRLAKGQDMTLRLELDGQALTVWARAAAAHHFNVGLPVNEEMFRRLKAARELSLFGEQHPLTFHLQGTAAALDVLRACVHRGVGVSDDATDPLSAPPDPAAPPPAPSGPWGVPTSRGFETWQFS